MAFPIEEKLVVGVASSALFQLAEADEIFHRDGLAAYREYQRKHQYDVLMPGVAFPFIKRLLNFNGLFPDSEPVEVVLLSHNDPDTGLRVFNSITHYNLGIVRAAFTTGDSPYKYIPAFNVSLFLSANENDVRKAIKEGYAAGQVVESTAADDGDDFGLRIAFDFDGVLADDSAETVTETKGLAAFHASERANADTPLPGGPLANFFKRLASLRKLEDMELAKNPDYRRYLRTAIVTARSAPAHERMVNTLRTWDIQVDDSFFLGGMNKGRILSILRPHIFFDDQKSPNLEASREFTPSVHIQTRTHSCRFGNDQLDFRCCAKFHCGAAVFKFICQSRDYKSLPVILSGGQNCFAAPFRMLLKEDQSPVFIALTFKFPPCQCSRFGGGQTIVDILR